MSEVLVSELLASIPQIGRLDRIGLRPASRAPIQQVDVVRAEAGRGLIGDRYAERPWTRRQVTLI